MSSVDSQISEYGPPAARPKEYHSFKNYDLPSLSKWSDCSFEVPFVPAPQPSSSSAASAASVHHPDHMVSSSSANTEDKIRKNLLENSYFYDLKSLPVMNNFKSTDDHFNGTRLGPQLNSQFYQSFFNQMDKSSSDYPHSSDTAASQLTRPSTSVTLPNHSKSSKFVEVKSTVSYSCTGRINYAEQMKLSHDGLMKFPRQITPPKVEEENLLTSERTHFRPIISYQDGYSFDIPNTLDDVKYSRSECGSIYLNDEKYMEYNPKCMEDDDEFLVKFCIKQNDKCCQTDGGAGVDRFSFHDRSGYACDRSTSVSTELCDREDDFNSSFGLCDEIDTYNKMDVNLDLESWTMGNCGRKCSRNENAHTLWEHCSGCSCDVASKPANQMMIEELCADGDQIMSDLRCMYIGSDWNEDDDEDEDDDDDDDDDSDDIDDDDDDNDGISVRGMHKEDDESEVVTVEPNNLLFNVSKLISDLLKPETAQSLVNAIGTNIFEEMANEGKKVVQIDGETNVKRNLCMSDKQRDAESSNFPNRFVGGLWSNNDSTNIWQRDLRPSTTDNRVWSGVRDTNWEHANLERIWNSDDDDDDDEPSPETIEIYDRPTATTTTTTATTTATTTITSTDATDGTDRTDTEPIESDFVFDLIETHELAIDNEALKRYIDFNRTFNGNNNNGNDQGNDDGFMSLHSNLNRCDRKRRHSASQSLSEALEAMIGEGADRKLASMFNDELNVTTIITCNYWTTDTSSYINGKNAALEINPTTSILKHIPMVSRPLTR